MALANDELMQEQPEQPQGQTTISPILITPPLPIQNTFVELALDDFEAAQTARDEIEYGYDSKGQKLSFDKWLEELKNLYFGKREPKTVPWKYCSNRSMMIAMSILEVLHARLFPAIYNEELTRYRPLNASDTVKTENVEKIMFWWVRVHSKLRDFFERWTRYVLGFGAAYTESAWDVHFVDKGQMSQPEPQMLPDGSVIVSEPQKMIEAIEKSRSDIIPIEDVFVPAGATDIQRDTVVVRKKYLYRELEEMETQGKLVNVSKPSELGAATLKEKILVPTPTGEGLNEQQIKQLEDIKRRNVPIEVLQWWGAIDIDGDGIAEQLRMWIVPDWKIYLGAVQVKDLSRRGMRHLDVTTFMPRIDDPNGLRGYGILEQVKEHALEIDALFNQMTDANTLNVMRPGFYDPAGDIDAAALNLSPNKMIPVSNPNQAIAFPEINIPTERLIMAIRLVLEFIERLTAASAYVMGKESETVGGSGTATRVQAIVSSAGQRHAIPVARLRDGASRILTQHLDLLQKRAQEGDGFVQALESRILEDSSKAVFYPNQLSDESLAGEWDAFLLPDESMGSKESERQLSMMLYQLLTQNLIVATDPAKLYKVTADVLKSFGKDPETVLGPEPPVNQARTPQEENAMIVAGDYAQVKPTVLDNPIEHIMAHQSLLQDPALAPMPPVLKQAVATFVMQHIQQHMQILQAVMAAQPKKGSPNASDNGKPEGGPGGRPAENKPVGSEPGVGSVQNPFAETRRTQRVGESQPPAGM